MAGSQVRQSLLQIQGGRYILERYPELHHGECHIRLYTNDYRSRAPQPDHVAEVSQSAGCERIQNVQRGDIDDDAARTVAFYLLDQSVPQLGDSFIRQSRLHSGNEYVALF